MVETSWMFLPPIVTARVVGLSRAPPQAEQGTSRMNSWYHSRAESDSAPSCRRVRKGRAPSYSAW